MIVPGIFNAKLITRGEKSSGPVQYGQLPQVKVPDPREELLGATMGSNDWYCANGAVEIPKDKIEFLGS